MGFELCQFRIVSGRTLGLERSARTVRAYPICMREECCEWTHWRLDNGINEYKGGQRGLVLGRIPLRPGQEPQNVIDDRKRSGCVGRLLCWQCLQEEEEGCHHTSPCPHRHWWTCFDCGGGKTAREAWTETRAAILAGSLVRGAPPVRRGDDGVEIPVCCWRRPGVNG